MNFNITFIVQIIAFLVFVFVCMKWIWPPIMQAIAERQKDIGDSIEAAKKANQDVEVAKLNASKIVDEAKNQAQEIVDSAEKRKLQIVDEATEIAKKEKERLLKNAEAEVLAEKNKAKEELRKEISSLAVQGAEKIISKTLDKKISQSLVDEAIDRL